MSKKKFTDGLESLFGMAHEDDLQESSPLLVDTREEVKVDKQVKKKSRTKKKSGKSFTSDLDSLFTAAITDALEKKTKKPEEENKEVASTSKPSALKRARRKTLTGIDALIRQTIAGSRVDYDEGTAKKRVTFIYDKNKLARLKAIAKVEKSYLKDIIGKVVSEFIDDYEKKHGENLL